MSEKIALIGFVNTEEILADKIRTQTPDMQVDGYELFPNEAFGRTVTNRFPLYGINEAGEFGLHNLSRLDSIKSLGYVAVNLGPIPAAFIAEDILTEKSIDYIGPRRGELAYELDKTLIVDVFPEHDGILPPTVVLEAANDEDITSTLELFGNDAVFKFVGEYSKYYQDSETRRVRMLNEFSDFSELKSFVAHSIEASGKALIQKRIDGQQFSHTVLVDGSGGSFRLGENICYKHRYDGDTGPLGDGTGSISINNTLPDLLSRKDIHVIENKIVQPYLEYIEAELGRSPKTFLNIDLIKATDGSLYLLEINGREPGGHTAAGLLSGLQTPLADALQATQEGRLSELRPVYKEGASVVVSAYPNNFPQPFIDENKRPTVVIPKLKSTDDVKIYTGWVDVEEDREDDVIARAKLSPTMLFSAHASDLKQASSRVYSRIAEIVPNGFDFRKDIGR